MTTGHDMAMFGSRKAVVFLDVSAVFQLSIAALQITPQLSSFQQPFDFAAVSRSGFGKVEQWGGSASPGSAGWQSEGLVSAVASSPTWVSRDVGAPWPLHVMSNSPRPFCWRGLVVVSGWSCVLWWLGFQRQKSEDAKPVEGCAHDGTTSFPPQSAVTAAQGLPRWEHLGYLLRMGPARPHCSEPVRCEIRDGLVGK